jgi:hypothetical protein
MGRQTQQLLSMAKPLKVLLFLLCGSLGIIALMFEQDWSGSAHTSEVSTAIPFFFVPAEQSPYVAIIYS